MRKSFLFTFGVLFSLNGFTQYDIMDEGAFIYPSRLIELVGHVSKQIDSQRAYDNQMIQLINSSKIQAANGIHQDIPREAYLAQHRETFKDSDNCNKIAFRNQLVSSIYNNCRAEDVKKICITKNRDISFRIEEQLSNMKQLQNTIRAKQVELSGDKQPNLAKYEEAFNLFFNNLVNLEKESITAFNDSFSDNEECSNSAKNILLTNECTSSYENVFNNNIDNLSKYCSKERFSQIMTGFTRIMSKGAFYHDLSEISQFHAKSRKLEAELVPVIGWIKKEKKIVQDAIESIQKIRKPANEKKENATTITNESLRGKT